MVRLTLRAGILNARPKVRARTGERWHCWSDPKAASHPLSASCCTGSIFSRRFHSARSCCGPRPPRQQDRPCCSPWGPPSTLVQPETPAGKSEHRMSNPVDGDATPITSLRQLAEHIAEGCKPPERFGIGTEHEKFGFRLKDLKTP